MRYRVAMLELRPNCEQRDRVAAASWSVYLLRCADGSLYTGIATDVARRVAEHEEGGRGARYLRGRGPLTLVFQREVGDRRAASRVEYRIKRLAKAEKERCLQDPARMELLLLASRDDVRRQ